MAEPQPSVGLPGKVKNGTVSIGITWSLITLCIGGLALAGWTYRGVLDDLATNNKAIEANRIAVIKLETRADAHDQQSNDVRRLIDKMTNDQEAVKKIEGRLDSLETHYNETRRSLDGLEHDIGSIDKSISRVEQSIKVFGERLDSLFEHVTGRRVPQ